MLERGSPPPGASHSLIYNNHSEAEPVSNRLQNNRARLSCSLTSSLSND